MLSFRRLLALHSGRRSALYRSPRQFGSTGKLVHAFRAGIDICEHFPVKMFGIIVSWAYAEKGRIAMTQTQIVQTLADSCEISKKVAKNLLDTLAHTAVTEVKKNGMFVLPGIGRLVRVDRKARMGRNPATGQAIKIAAKKVVKFRVAKAAKDAIVPPKKGKA
jgi:DNA-binding protein HU-beta